jgi:hypothetical protein
MPYIKQVDRPPIKEKALELAATCSTSGELNFAITTIILAFLGEHPKYDDFNTVIGVLECAKLELYRIQIAEYEELKRHLNGKIEV